MKIRANFDEAVALDTETMDWSPSPMAGVERRMLDRIGGEIARATSIVRYAHGSHFSEHTHSGGEEFIVLEGVFQDEHDDYPAGTYVRNPVGTRHVPRSDDGCTIFVKLWQFDPEDQEQFSVDLNSIGLSDMSDTPGIARAVLSDRTNELVVLESWGADVERHLGPDGGAELLVLAGQISFQGEQFAKHGWIRIPAGESMSVRAGEEGARVWIKSRHLKNVRAPSN
ncbi:hypothetical protein BPTFM16_00366 [Altererythrobacter insulae]|nr:hypothetical protein BPTFM16_00366 [Altererythrobacter insulae]